MGFPSLLICLLSTYLKSLCGVVIIQHTIEFFTLSLSFSQRLYFCFVAITAALVYCNFISSFWLSAAWILFLLLFYFCSFYFLKTLIHFLECCSAFLSLSSNLVGTCLFAFNFVLRK